MAPCRHRIVVFSLNTNIRDFRNRILRTRYIIVNIKSKSYTNFFLKITIQNIEKKKENIFERNSRNLYFVKLNIK